MTDTHASDLRALATTALIVVTVFVYDYWLLDARTFFYADDWQWLWRARFVPWSLHDYPLLPAAVYNDRPVGAAFIKLLYGAVGLDHRIFQFVLLCIHALNCVLLYAVAVAYTGRGAALLAALLAAVWFSANNTAIGYTAAIFDVLGATLCLVTLWLYQRSRRSATPLPYVLAGTLCYFLASRTKEFALGMIAVLFLASLLVERQSLRAAIKQLAPYSVVFVILAIRYAQLFATHPPAASDPYRLDLSLQSLISGIGFYVRALFYVETASDLMILALLLCVFGWGMLVADDRARRVALFGLTAYVILLGPTLLIPRHHQSLYLYAPHFFFALAVGALLIKRTIPGAAALALSAAVIIAPTLIHSREYAIGFVIEKGEANQSMFYSALNVLPPISRGASIFIAGVEPFFNPFLIGPGHSLKVALGDNDLRVEVEKPDDELIAQFCATPGERRFLRFDAARAVDVTATVEGSCTTSAAR